MSDSYIGTREFGKRNIHERWFVCAIMGDVKPESQTVVLRWPSRFAGLRVCHQHLDEMDYEERFRIQPPRISSTEHEP